MNHHPPTAACTRAHCCSHLPSQTQAHARSAGAARRHGLAIAVAALALIVAAPLALAHGPTPQKIDEAVDIAAPPAAVWALVSDFGNYAAWNPALRASSADRGNATGSARTLTLARGGQLVEELDERSDEEMTLSYRSGRVIDAKVLPASSYSVRLRVRPQGAGSRLEWRARAYRADTGNEPAAGSDDAAAVQALQEHARTALEAARRKLETR